MAGTATLMALKATTATRDYEDEKAAARSRDVLVLVRDYLLTAGYVDTATSLKGEGGKTLGRFESADNVDLFTIMHDFEEYYKLKFNKEPKLTRRAGKGIMETVSSVFQGGGGCNWVSRGGLGGACNWFLKALHACL